MERAGKIVTKEDLTEIALNREHTRYDRSIDVHISSIRKKYLASSVKKKLSRQYADLGIFL